MTLPIVLTIAGCAALLVGLLGGGVKAKEIEVPKISLLPRIVSSLTGLVLIGVAIRMSPLPQAEVSPTPILPSEIPLIQVSATPIPPNEVLSTEVPPTIAASPTANLGLAMTATAFSVQATQMESTSQAIAAKQRAIELTQTAVWLKSQIWAGQWYWNGSPGPVISVDGNALRIDMSVYGRPAATGRILNESTIEVTFPDDATYIGKLVKPNQIQWPNGTIWEKF